VSSTQCSLSRLDHAVSLAGEWEFQLDPAGELDVESMDPDRTIAVPLPWQAASPDLRRYAGYAWYRRTFEVDGDLGGGDLRLRFGAVDYWCQVFLNGTPVIEHEGGYTPFEIGLRDALVVGRNELTVRVFDPVQTAVAHERWPDFEGQQRAAREGPPFIAAHVPHGKQDWYVNTGGIWQDVTLTPRPAAWIDHLHVTPDLDRARVDVEVRIAGDVDRIAGSALRLEVQVDGATDARSEVALTPGERSCVSSIAIPQARAWTLDAPFLYDLVASLDVDGRQTRTVARFGMRSFGVRDGGFVLNGAPVYLVGALDQDFWPDTVATVPTRDRLRDQFRTAKQLGFNCLRCHIKVPDPIYLDLADEIGLLVWEELPSWRTYWTKGTLDPAQIEQPAEVRARVETLLDALIDRDFNHPSVVIRTLVNEDWGTTLPFSASDRAWVADLYDRSKRLDPTRLIVDNSACAAPWGASFHVKSDIDDFHLYAVIPDQATTFADTVADLALRPLWTFSPHGDAQRRGDEPIVLSEFGNWGLPTLAAVGGGSDREPDWFDVRPWGSGWGQEPGSPAGVEARFHRYGLGAIWPGYDDFAIATQGHQAAALRFQVETLRGHSSIAGYVITELSDTYWESNGLLDFERRLKAPIADIAAFNAQDVLIATADRRSYASGEEARIDLAVSRYSGRVEGGSTIQWSVDDRERAERLAVTGGAAGSTAALGPINVRLPEVEILTYAQISISLVAPDGSVTASTVANVAVVPAVVPTPMRGTMGVLDDPGAAYVSGPLRERLAAEGYPVASTLGQDSDVAVANIATQDLLTWVRSGGRLLFLAERRNPFFWIRPRRGADGGWISSFSWIRPSAHSRLGTAANPLGLEFGPVMPEHAVAGLPFDDPVIHGDVLAGTVVGWVHHPTADTVQFRYGRGRVVLTTFRLGSTVGLDPIAKAMFHDLVEHLRSEACRPALGADLDHLGTTLLGGT
jgi:Glycosyl hydrolases family 2, sugar binding domain/Glycosyl hydrolases family 2, TIM barrel domain/Glycosyl hydrolases family 2